MSKLKKEEFNTRFRFRQSREHHPECGRQNYVNCVSCIHQTGGLKFDETAHCEHPQRFRRIKLGEYHGPGFSTLPSSWNIAKKTVCDGYESQPLPEDVELPVLNEGQAILLGTQYRDPYHADVNCPYVVEETRRLGSESPCLKRADIYIADISDMVPGEIIREICDMPCCEKKLPFQQIYNPNGYRHRVGLKPDGSEPKKWVRNAIKPHGKNSDLTPEQAEAFFDLSRFNDLRSMEKYKRFKRITIHDEIVAVSDYLRKGCNWLGSRPLSEASNPVRLGGYHHIFDDELVGEESHADVWVYHDMLFNFEQGLPKPLAELDSIPEGILPCMDTKGVFRTASRYGESYFSKRFSIDGILREIEEGDLFDKGLRHKLEIRAVSFHAHSHMWGEFGVGFEGLASFHEQ